MAIGCHILIQRIPELHSHKMLYQWNSKTEKQNPYESQLAGTHTGSKKSQNNIQGNIWKYQSH